VRLSLHTYGVWRFLIERHSARPTAANGAGSEVAMIRILVRFRRAAQRRNEISAELGVLKKLAQPKEQMVLTHVDAELNLNDIKGVEHLRWMHGHGAAPAAVTERIELMVAVRPPTFHLPALLAKQRPHRSISNGRSL